MNKEQIEAAARHYVKSTGFNPDEMCKLREPQVGPNGPVTAIERWKLVAPAIQDQWRLLEAINAATQEKS